MRTANNRPLTALEQALVTSGRDLNWCAKRLAEPGSNASQIRNAEAVLRRHLRHGNASWNYARRVAHLLGFEDQPLHDLLLKPRVSWPAWATAGQGASHPQGATETPGKAVSRRREAGNCGPASHHSTPRRGRSRAALEVI